MHFFLSCFRLYVKLCTAKILARAFLLIGWFTAIKTKFLVTPAQWLLFFKTNGQNWLKYDDTSIVWYCTCISGIFANILLSFFFYRLHRKIFLVKVKLKSGIVSFLNRKMTRKCCDTEKTACAVLNKKYFVWSFQKSFWYPN